MPHLFSSFLGHISLHTGCTIILLLYLMGNFGTVFTCVSIYTFGDSLFTVHPNNKSSITMGSKLITSTWNYYLIFVFITSCQREFIWISVAAIGFTILAFVGTLMEIPTLMMPFLAYEIGVNIFFSYVKILWCMVYGLALHSPIEFVVFLVRIYFWLVLLSYCVKLYLRS